ncbi:MAG TPA: phage tail protein [Candidatus Limnocylindria bacterium]|nr:phage tail protein [Candidatus Limnocylindria bacterium]
MEDTTAVTRAPADEEPARAVRTSRRSFIGTAAGLTGAALAAGAWRPVGDPREVAPGRTYLTGKFALELDGTDVGFLKRAEGGNVTADVVTTSSGTYYRSKHIANLRYEDFELDIDLSLAGSVYQWINASWTGGAPRKDGAIVVADQSLNAISRREFKEALITETRIPACDAASKDAGVITLRLAVEQAQKKAASGKVSGNLGTKQKTWSPANFRLDVQGVDAKKVSKIDAFSVKQGVTESSGEFRHPEKTPSQLEYGDLVVTVAESGSADWTKWFDDFVIAGNNGEDKEKQAALSFLSPNLGEVLAHIHFWNVGIYSLADAPASAGDTLRKVIARLYYERAEFHIGPWETGPDGPVYCVKCA